MVCAIANVSSKPETHARPSSRLLFFWLLACSSENTVLRAWPWSCDMLHQILRKGKSVYVMPSTPDGGKLFENTMTDVLVLGGLNAVEVHAGMSADQCWQD
jgi:hypothetical protein